MSTLRISDPRRRRAGVLLLVGLGLLAVTWPLPNEALIPSAPGVDPSWQAALALTVRNPQIHFGNQFIFTYGPLGFLTIPALWGTKTGLLAWLFTALTRLALVVLLFARCRRWLGAPGSVLLVLLALPLVHNVDEAAPLLALGAAVWLLAREDPPTVRFAALAGVGAAVELLAKTGTGIAVAAVLALALAFAPRQRVRGLGVFVLVTTLMALVLWILLGQPPGAVPDFVRYTLSTVSGYSEAMSIESPTVVWEYTAALALGLAGLVAAIRLWGLARPRARTGLALTWLVFAFLVFKQSFVRADVSHSSTFFVVMAPALALLPWTRARRTAGILVCLGALLALYAATDARLDRTVDPVARADLALDQLGVMTSGAQRQAGYDRGRRALRAAYAVPPELMPYLGRLTTHVFSSDVAVAWALGLNWRPLPVAQSYAAYTAALDRLNAAALADPARAPERILYRASPTTLAGGQLGLDGRQLGFDSPAANVAMLCRYRDVAAAGAWAVLARVPSRCGAERLVRRTESAWGARISVPPLGRAAFLLARPSGVAVSGLERIRTILFKARDRQILLDGHPFRLVLGTASDGLQVAAARGLDLPAPFALAPHPRVLEFRRAGEDHGPISVRFHAVARRP